MNRASAPTSAPPRLRVAGLFVSTALFMVGIGIGATLYPGGTWFDKGYVGHHLWHTFFCDMLRDPALNGEPNPAVAWTSVGLGAVALALGFFWSLLRRLLVGQQRLAGIAQWLGGIGLVGIAAIPLTPSDVYALAHELAVSIGGATTLAAVLLTVIGLFRDRATLLACLGLATLALFLVSLALYIHQGFLGGELMPLLPASQKVAAGLAVAWFGTTGVSLLRKAL